MKTRRGWPVPVVRNSIALLNALSFAMKSQSTNATAALFAHATTNAGATVFRDDPSTSLFKLRQFAELTAKLVAAHTPSMLASGRPSKKRFALAPELNLLAAGIFTQLNTTSF